jgi:hypothetical protein
VFSRLISRLRYPLPQRRPGPLGFEPLEPREVPATVYGLTANNTLLRFDSAAPSVIQRTVAITGLEPNQTIVGIDFGPRGGTNFAISVATGSASNSVITPALLNPVTGAVIPVSPRSALPGAGDVPTGYDTDPTALFGSRYVNVNDENAHLSNGLLVDDTNLSPAGTQIVAVAYDRNFPRTNTANVPTTLYGISRATSSLVTIGGIDGSAPGGTNGGIVATIGPLGVPLDAGTDAGFDIAKSTDNGGLGTALAALTVGGVTGLYSINLSTGTATRIDNIGSGAAGIRSLTIVPEGALVVGSGAGANGDVRILDPDTGAIRQAIVPFAGFQGGVRVAAGDVNHDGTPDAIVSADAPQGHVKVFDGATGAQLGGFIGSFFAFEGFLGTVNIAAGDVNGDGFADVIVSANGVSGHVKAFSGADGSLLASFLAYPGFAGVTTVAAADFDNDGKAEIVTVAAFNGHVKVFHADGSLFTVNLPPTLTVGFFSPGGPTPINFLAFPGFTGTVNVAADPANAGIVVSTGAGTRGHVKAFGGPAFMSQLASFFAYPAGFIGGAFVGLADANNDGILDICVTPGAGLPADVQSFGVLSAFAPPGTPTGVTFPAFAGYLSGATVAGARF